MNIDNRALCLQGRIKSITKPFNNGTLVEILIELGAPQGAYSGELAVRVPARDRRVFKVGMRYSIPVIPHGEGEGK